MLSWMLAVKQCHAFVELDFFSKPRDFEYAARFWNNFFWGFHWIMGLWSRSMHETIVYDFTVWFH